MQLTFFFKLFFISLAISLAAFALTPNVGFLFLAKSIALGIGLSIVMSSVYPLIRGIRKGDTVAVVVSNSVPFLLGRVGRALTNARKNNEIKVRFDNGEEAIGIVESYAGLISPPKIRILYEERLAEEKSF